MVVRLSFSYSIPAAHKSSFSSPVKCCFLSAFKKRFGEKSEGTMARDPASDQLNSFKHSVKVTSYLSCHHSHNLILSIMIIFSIITSHQDSLNYFHHFSLLPGLPALHNRAVHKMSVFRFSFVVIRVYAIVK